MSKEKYYYLVEIQDAKMLDDLVLSSSEVTSQYARIIRRGERTLPKLRECIETLETHRLLIALIKQKVQLILNNTQ